MRADRSSWRNPAERRRSSSLSSRSSSTRSMHRNSASTSFIESSCSRASSPASAQSALQSPRDHASRKDLPPGTRGGARHFYMLICFQKALPLWNPTRGKLLGDVAHRFVGEGRPLRLSWRVGREICPNYHGTGLLAGNTCCLT